MCRYATAYKSHYACFDCQKTFKRRLQGDLKLPNKVSLPAKCPDCGQLMANMGLDFASPKKKDNKAWAHMRLLYEVGITFHSCGCTGPGYIPRDKAALLAHLQTIEGTYIEHLRFWAQRETMPQSKAAHAADRRANYTFFRALPRGFEQGTRRRPYYDKAQALAYWKEKVQAIQQHIAQIEVQLLA